MARKEAGYLVGARASAGPTRYPMARSKKKITGHEKRKSSPEADTWSSRGQRGQISGGGTRELRVSAGPNRTQGRRNAPQPQSISRASSKIHGRESYQEKFPAFPGGGMGITRGYGVGTRETPARARPAQSGRRVIGGIWPGEGMGLPVKGPTAPGSAARPNLNAAGSMRANARSPMPVSVLNSGRSYYAPLNYSSPLRENRPYTRSYNNPRTDSGSYYSGTAGDRSGVKRRLNQTDPGALPKGGHAQGRKTGPSRAGGSRSRSR